MLLGFKLELVGSTHYLISFMAKQPCFLWFAVPPEKKNIPPITPFLPPEIAWNGHEVDGFGQEQIASFMVYKQEDCQVWAIHWRDFDGDFRLMAYKCQTKK